MHAAVKHLLTLRRSLLLSYYLHVNVIMIHRIIRIHMISGQVLRNRMAVLKEAEQYGAVLRVLRIAEHMKAVL